MSLIYLFYPFFLCFFFYKSKIDLETRLRPKRKQKTDKQNRLRKHICVEKGAGGGIGSKYVSVLHSKEVKY